MQAPTKQRRLDAHVVAIVHVDATVEALEGEVPWRAALLENMGTKALAALIVRKVSKPKPKGKKSDLVLQVVVLWATK